jgi:6-phosphogluconolactonase
VPKLSRTLQNPSGRHTLGGMTGPEIKVLPDPASVAREAAERFVRLAREAIADHGRFSVALAGGSTPKAMYELLAAEPLRSQVDWARVLAFFGDERCVPPDHKDSNYRMAEQALLTKVPIPGDNVYRMRGETDPNGAAKEYGLTLKEMFPSTNSGQGGGGEGGNGGGLDLVLLGMGDDGHTLSLFPGTAAVGEREHRVVANYAEKSTTGKSWRITMTAPFVNRARHVIVAVTGAGKAARVKEVLEGPREPERLPIQLIQPTDGTMTWLLDTGAAGMREA